MTLRLKIYINRSKVVDDTYNLGGGQNLFITTLSNVPEGSTYRIRFIVRDSLSGQKSKGGFKKLVDCIDEPVSTTTTTVPVSTTTTAGPVSTTTTAGPVSTTTTAGPVSTTTTAGPVSTTTTTVPTNPDLIDDKCLLTVVRSFNIQNLLDCIDENKPDTTDPDTTDPDTTDPDTTDPDTTDPDTTDPDTTDPDTTDPTGVPTTTEEDDFCEGLILEEGDVCVGPLTEDEGNDFFEWDEYDEDVYLTDGSYKVQYFYTEDSMKLAATGINLSSMVISSILLFLSGLFLFTKNRKKDLYQMSHLKHH